MLSRIYKNVNLLMLLLVVVLVCHCLHGLAPSYLTEGLLCTADIDSRRRLRSASTFCTHYSYDASCHWQPHLLCGSRKYLEQPAVWSHVSIIFVHIHAPAQDATFCQKLSWQLPDAHDKPFSSCAANSVFSFDAVRCPCSYFDITPPKSALWWMNEWTVDITLRSMYVVYHMSCHSTTYPTL